MLAYHHPIDFDFCKYRLHSSGFHHQLEVVVNDAHLHGPSQSPEVLHESLLSPDAISQHMIEPSLLKPGFWQQ